MLVYFHIKEKMKTPIKNNINWVGKIDWELRKFHGNEYSTHKGSSYNSFLIQEEKTALIDTVWAPFAKEFVANLENELDLNSIDFIIANHGEIDHSGALPELMRHIPNTPIYCTANGIKSLKGHYHQDWNFHPIKTGEKLKLGNGKELIFIEAPMLHWPDTMFCYLTGDNVLFSNDGFGQHYASEYLFNDLVDQHELFCEAIKYYANILTPFSSFVTKKITEVLSLNLPLDIICPSHGVIWRKNPTQIIEKYLTWADNYQENQITIIYDTMWDGTRVMAENIAQGICHTDKEVNVKLFNAANSDKNDIVTEIFKSKAILLGSPTINNGIATSIAALLEEIKGLKLKNKKASMFGCYGWSGEANKIIAEQLKTSGFDVIDDGIKALWNPDQDAIKKCWEYGAMVFDKIGFCQS
jgi:anaerobic nitric oxide reductase flavorubredoxin